MNVLHGLQCPSSVQLYPSRKGCVSYALQTCLGIKPEVCLLPRSHQEGALQHQQQLLSPAGCFSNEPAGVQEPTLTMAVVCPVPDTKLSFRGEAAATGVEEACLCCLHLKSRNSEDVRHCCLNIGDDTGDSKACLPWSGHKHDMSWFLKLNLRTSVITAI